MDPKPIKSLPERKNVLRSLIITTIKEGDCYDACKLFVYHCENGSYHIQGDDIYQSYSPVAHSESFRINISIVTMHRFPARIFDVRNAF